MGEPPSIDPVANAALRWLVRRHSGELDAAGQRAFEAWLAASPEHRRAYAEAETLWEHTSHLRFDADTGHVAVAPARTPLVAPRFPARIGAWGYRAAAVFAIALSIAWHWDAHLWVLADHVTGPDIQRLVLADGSIVYLDARSALNIDMNETLRRVDLRRGAAWFTVAPDRRAFEVVAGALWVRALGTEFMVRRTAAGERVAVTEHAVEVALGNAPRQRRLVQAGQGLEATGGAPERWEIGPIDAAKEGTWRSGRLVMEERTLGEIAAVIETYRYGFVVVTDEALRRHRVSGVFDIAHPDRALDSLVHAAPVRIAHLSPLLTLIMPAP